MLRKIIIGIFIVCYGICAGCQTHAENRKLAQKRWEKSSAVMKLTLARQQYEQGDYAKAMQAVEQCLKSDPENADAHLLYGKLLLADGNNERAVEQFNLTLKSNEKCGETLYWLGVAAQENEDYQKAYQNYERALELEPTNVDYILAVADVQVAENNCPQAIELLTAKMATLPRDVSLKVAAADLMCRTGRIDQAVELYKETMLLTGDNEVIAEALGYCYVFSGRWEDAAEIFSKLVEGCKDKQKNKLYLQVLGLCSMNSTQYCKAYNCYSRLGVEERDNAEIWMKMGEATLGAGESNRAFMCGQKAIALRPGYADAIALIGCSQYVAGDYSAAAKSFEMLASDSKKGAFSWLMRARCYERLGLMREAEAAYQEALKIQPNSQLGNLLAKGRE